MIAITIARKPLIGTVVSNVAAFGTGGLNIDGCRIPVGVDEIVPVPQGSAVRSIDSRIAFTAGTSMECLRAASDKRRSLGRWPNNVIISPATRMPSGEERYFYRTE